jgi:hypothetical protein
MTQKAKQPVDTMHPKIMPDCNPSMPFYSSVASSTLGARSRFTTPEVSAAGVAVVVAEGVESPPLPDAVSCGSAASAPATAFLDFFFFLLYGTVSTSIEREDCGEKEKDIPLAIPTKA